MVQITAGTGSSKRPSDEYPETLNLYLNPTQQHGTIPAAEGWWHDGHNEPSGVGDSDLGGKAQGSLRPAGATLKTFLEHGVITQAQHGKSLHDLTEKIGYADE